MPEETAQPVKHAVERRRFEVEAAGQTAYLEYDWVDDRTLEYRFTWVPPVLRRRGVGTRLVQHALRWASEQGFTVIPTCPFVARVTRDPNPT